MECNWCSMEIKNLKAVEFCSKICLNEFHNYLEELEEVK